MTPHPEDAMTRECFEAWERKRYVTALDRNPKGTWGDEAGEKYAAPHVQSSWEAWQAALASLAQGPAPSAEAGEVAWEVRENIISNLAYCDRSIEEAPEFAQMIEEEVAAALCRYAGDGGVTWQPIETAPCTPWVRIIGWCVYPAGSEWREVQRSPSGEWRAYGLTQNVTHWLPRPEYPPPAARAKPSEKDGDV